MSYMSVYAVTRHYGGPEEGGWWFNRRKFVEAVPCRSSLEEAAAGAVLELKYADQQPEYPISSVLGDEPEYRVISEEVPGEFQQLDRRHYE